MADTDHHHAEESGHHHDSEHPESWWGRLRHGLGHDHDHAPNTALLDTGAEGIRATKVSLVGLGITAPLQAVIVVFSGSVALLSDTLHNLTDALTAIPLWIALSPPQDHGPHEAPTSHIEWGARDVPGAPRPSRRSESSRIERATLEASLNGRTAL